MKKIEKVRSFIANGIFETRTLPLSPIYGCESAILLDRKWKKF